MCCEHESIGVVCPPLSRVSDERRPQVRCIGLGVQREFCGVVISEEGRVRSGGRIRTRRQELELFAQGLGLEDEVALETTGGGAARIAELLRPHVARVVVANAKKLRQISEGQGEDRPARGPPAGRAAGRGWPRSGAPMKERGRCGDSSRAGPSSCVSARGRRTRSPAALQRNLLDRPGVYDVAGERGRRFLHSVELPADERNTVASCLRQIDFLDAEIAELGPRTGPGRGRLHSRCAG